MLTGSSMYAGSPAPHLLQAVTLNRYSLASTTSVTVCSRSRTPVATCGSKCCVVVLSIRVCVCGGGRGGLHCVLDANKADGSVR